ncbi:uncharacterized protein LOC125177817 [Hyalella azteca]|uniref:Uncharacterized protein LOC125177817 n=1 Tax=Hyalella azteca TaxID=294128 RepID=A0A979FHP1_HYAAZ|nr:uncharacterized protein LOC125177817 [Hyalella azteca]
MTITKKMLLAAGSAKKACNNYLAEVKEQNAKAQKPQKRMALLDELDEQKKKRRSEEGIKALEVRLVEFSGCVGPAEVAAIASVANGAVLRIRLAAPLDLSVLRGTYKDLFVYTRLIPPPGPLSPTWSLPPSPLPRLRVEGADEGSWGAVAHTITSLAPPGKRFRWLSLWGCRLRAAELRLLLHNMLAACIRTGGGGDTRAEVGKEGAVVLHITERVPPGGPVVPSDAQLQEALQEHLRLRRQ